MTDEPTWITQKEWANAIDPQNPKPFLGVIDGGIGVELPAPSITELEAMLDAVVYVPDAVRIRKCSIGLIKV